MNRESASEFLSGRPYSPMLRRSMWLMIQLANTTTRNWTASLGIRTAGTMPCGSRAANGLSRNPMPMNIVDTIARKISKRHPERRPRSLKKMNSKSPRSWPGVGGSITFFLGFRRKNVTERMDLCLSNLLQQVIAKRTYTQRRDVACNVSRLQGGPESALKKFNSAELVAGPAWPLARLELVSRQSTLQEVELPSSGRKSIRRDPRNRQVRFQSHHPGPMHISAQTAGRKSLETAAISDSCLLP